MQSEQTKKFVMSDLADLSARFIATKRQLCVYVKLLQVSL